MYIIYNYGYGISHLLSIEYESSLSCVNHFSFVLFPIVTQMNVILYNGVHKRKFYNKTVKVISVISQILRSISKR